MRLIVFGGTTEGRLLSGELARLGAAVTVCVATGYGREEQGEQPGVEVRAGRLDAEQMCAVLAGADLCVDATHPYAKLATAAIRAACESTGTPLRLLRPASQVEGAVRVPSCKAAAEFLADRPGALRRSWPPPAQPGRSWCWWSVPRTKGKAWKKSWNRSRSS